MNLTIRQLLSRMDQKNCQQIGKFCFVSGSISCQGSKFAYAGDNLANSLVMKKRGEEEGRGGWVFGEKQQGR